MLRIARELVVTDGRLPSPTLPLVDPGLTLQIVAIAALMFAPARGRISGSR
jgi:hypothetical protein